MIGKHSPLDMLLAILSYPRKHLHNSPGIQSYPRSRCVGPRRFIHIVAVSLLVLAHPSRNVPKARTEQVCPDMRLTESGLYSPDSDSGNWRGTTEALRVGSGGGRTGHCKKTSCLDQGNRHVAYYLHTFFLFRENNERIEQCNVV